MTEHPTVEDLRSEESAIYDAYPWLADVTDDEDLEVFLRVNGADVRRHWRRLRQIRALLWEEK